MELVLVSSHPYPLQHLVQEALYNELRLVQAGLERTGQKLAAFEANYHLSTAEFIQRYENDELEETLEFAEWIGEHRLLERLREKADVLQGIHFAN